MMQQQQQQAAQQQQQQQASKQHSDVGDVGQGDDGRICSRQKAKRRVR